MVSDRSGEVTFANNNKLKYLRQYVFFISLTALKLVDIIQ